MIFRQSYAFYLVAARKSYISHIKFGLFISKVNRMFAVKREYPGFGEGLLCASIGRKHSAIFPTVGKMAE